MYILSAHKLVNSTIDRTIKHTKNTSQDSPLNRPKKASLLGVIKLCFLSCSTTDNVISEAAKRLLKTKMELKLNVISAAYWRLIDVLFNCLCYSK